MGVAGVTPDEPAPLRMDGMRLAVLTARFEGIARKMANTLQRTGRSGILTIARDFSCVVLTAGHELLATAESLPIHVLRGPDRMARTMVENHPRLTRGDAFLHNSPYHGCTHPADHSILVPFIDDDGVHRFTVLAKGHQADCGNALPTTYMGAATDVYAEGALIFPAVKIQEDYRHCMDIVRMCQMRIRVPEQWWGDYLATLGAARVGEREILALGAELGWDALHSYTSEWFDYSEQRMIDVIRRMPRGRVMCSSTHDPFPGTPTDGVTIKVAVEVNPEEALIEVDLRDNPDCMPNGLNLSEACALSAPMLAVFNSIDHTVPKNEGSFRRLRIHLRDNCIVGRPLHPTSCSVATTNIADRVANPVQRALADPCRRLGHGRDRRGYSTFVRSDLRHSSRQALRKRSLSRLHGRSGCTADGRLVDDHPRWQRRHVLPGLDRAGRDAPSASSRRSPPPPRHGRGGALSGAFSAFSEFTPLDGDMTVAYVSDGNINAPQGARGGGEGGRSAQFKRLRDGTLEPQPGCAEVVVCPGEAMVSISCGGGGYGYPFERELSRVARDVSEGWVSKERAEAVYGVVLAADGTVDEARTRSLRVGAQSSGRV